MTQRIVTERAPPNWRARWAGCPTNEHFMSSQQSTTVTNCTVTSESSPPSVIHQDDFTTEDNSLLSNVISPQDSNPQGPPLQVTEMEEREEDVLLPCQFCLELFSISIFESHQEHCMNRDDASSHFPATSSLYGEPFSTPPSSPPSATSYHSTSQLVNSTPPPPFILTPPATPQRTANTQPNNVHSLPSHATNGPSTLERESSILAAMGGYVQCHHCHVKLLSCSVDYHEKICPQKSDTPIQNVTIGGVPYMKCRHCSVSLLSCSVKYHERICPQNPIPFIPARIPLRIPQPTNNPYWNPTQITPQDSLRNSQGDTTNTADRHFTNINTSIHDDSSSTIPSGIITQELTTTEDIESTYIRSDDVTVISPANGCTDDTEEPPSNAIPATCTSIQTPVQSSVDTLDINIVTWNLNKGTVPRGASTAGFADTRRFLIHQFSQEHPNSLYCFQEIDFAFAMPTYSHQYGGNRLKHAGIACPSLQTNLAMETIDPPTRGTTRCMYDNVANCRFYGKQVSIKDSNGEVQFKFLLVSYHGKHYQMREDMKIQEITNFFEQMCSIADIHHMSVIIGGDFNLRLHAWNIIVEELYPGRVHIAQEYTPGPRRGGVELIDTFAVVYPSADSTYTHCTIGQPQAVSLTDSLPGLEQMYGQAQAGVLFNLMDHDPVIVQLTLNI